MDISEMTLIKSYELHYISRDFFLEQLLGCGQRTIAEEGIDRFKFYIEREAGRLDYDYFLIPYSKSSVQ
ncbi:hypothetical protein LIZ91_06255 [Enterococcus avium]|uniref:Uncharacterized protein n=1 Tax=Enterococcus dongliensis TaxID=2559925 RepID=A0AAW8TJG3_9ENTE|nr:MULTISPECIES: hypothetical protein [Enterococcus]MCB6916186.1 hypothetical protein [Enterococcus avium]MCQ4960043.1 hypothetical protein [Enterococcus avium]MDT2597716.1 hypothetical protein [Enterococcus dongliensis]MDT2638441.1 hypothetical protein [Enterococcus dongliensis]MDT2643790.1 hypothetical protein [Enterococcus dongliensis]